MGEVPGPRSGGAPAGEGRRSGVEDDRTGGDGVPAGVAQDQPVAGLDGQRVVQGQPDHRPAEGPQPDRDRGRAEVGDELGRQVGARSPGVRADPDVERRRSTARRRA